jgi:hypothetical protein
MGRKVWWSLLTLSPMCLPAGLQQAFCLVALNGPQDLVTAQQRQRIAALLGAAPLPAGMTALFKEGSQGLLSACAHNMFSTVGEDSGIFRGMLTAGKRDAGLPLAVRSVCRPALLPSSHPEELWH